MFSATDFATDMIASPMWGWTPAGSYHSGPYHYTPTSCRQTRGPMGDDAAWVLRRRKANGWEYAVLLVASNERFVRCARNPCRSAIVTGDPLLDTSSVLSVATFGPRKEAVATLAKM